MRHRPIQPRVRERARCPFTRLVIPSPVPALIPGRGKERPEGQRNHESSTPRGGRGGAGGSGDPGALSLRCRAELWAVGLGSCPHSPQCPLPSLFLLPLWHAGLQNVLGAAGPPLSGPLWDTRVESKGQLCQVQSEATGNTGHSPTAMLTMAPRRPSRPAADPALRQVCGPGPAPAAGGPCFPSTFAGR